MHEKDSDSQFTIKQKKHSNKDKSKRQLQQDNLHDSSLHEKKNAKKADVN